MDNRFKGALVASAVAGLFLAHGAFAADAAPADDANVKCVGINTCKGTSQCGVPGKHSCHGANECKGKGWIKATAKDCKDKGGTVLE